MCLICGYTHCSADEYLESDKDGYLVTQTDEYNLMSVGTTAGGKANLKWNNDTRGAASGEITWSMNLAGLSIAPGSRMQEFIDATFDAFNTWAAVAGLTFRFTGEAEGADIDIDVKPLAGSTIGIANTSYNPDDRNGNGLTQIGSVNLSMDKDVTWIASGDSGPFTFFQVMLHELGHSLGLGHFNVSDSIMNATANNGSRTLGDDDIAGIQNLYGERQWSNAAENVDFQYVGVGQTAHAKGGNDTLNGTAQADRFYGGAGNDKLSGNNGDDVLVDTRGDNDISGGNGADKIFGGDGRIDAEGNSGNDLIVGGINNDKLHGGPGNDILRGDPSGSFISGDDILIAGSGNDTLQGGGGADTFVFNRTTGNNTITDFEIGVDMIDLDGWNVGQGNLSTSGGDTILTYKEGGTNFTLTIEDAILTETDFM